MTGERRVQRRWRRGPRDDRRGMGGFYEAIMAMMIVTAGVVLLTASFTFLAVGGEDNALVPRCRDAMSAILENRDLAVADRILDQRALDRADWSSVRGDWNGGMKIMLAFPDGRTSVLFETGGLAGGERSSLSEPVDLLSNGGMITPALLTVWVWI
ncbi:MAG: hypothetical protein ISF22_07660 [Methanomassiliicoccus sp.]|nr:hypothetical protein [Methanomassiliicoccus sp.]